MNVKITPIWLLVFLSILCSAQEIVKNSERPLNGDAGRILKLTEALRINSEGRGYFFNAPIKLKVISQGNLLFTDSWSSRQRAHLMMFSSDGKYLGDFLRIGEGPGEIQSRFDFCASGKEVFLYDYSKRKVVVVDIKGEFVKEWSNKDERFEELIGFYDDRLISRITTRPTEKKKSRLYEEQDTVFSVSSGGESKKVIYTFSKQMFYISPTQGGGMMSWDPFISAIDENRLYICHSREYLIEMLDLETGKITHRFSREYERVKHEKQDWEDKFVKEFNAPRIRFESDIEALFSSDGMLWVQTSTGNDEKGALFDVFTHDGIYADSFSIGIKGRFLGVVDGYIYFSETDEDHLPSIVKYRIDEGIGHIH